MRTAKARPPRHGTRARHRTRPQVEPLEGRCTPTVDLLDHFAGLDFHIDAPAVPPDPHLAAGPRHLVEVVNNDIAFYRKRGGSPVFKASLVTFFGDVLPPGRRYLDVFDPRTSYDEMAGRFIVTAVEVDDVAQTSHLLLAVSDDDDPRGNWEMHRINVEEEGTFWGDHGQLGWDADGIYVTLLMFPWDGVVHHTRVISIDKGSVLDANAATLTYFDVKRSGDHSILTPAVMHDAPPGAPMYFVEPAPFGHGGATVRVVRMTNKLTPHPTWTEFSLVVPPYDAVPLASQPSGEPLSTVNLGASIKNVAWRNGRLVASHHAGAKGLVRARWYEFQADGARPALVQWGQIDPGPGVHTYYPAIEIAPNGDLGMTYMQSSATEFLSVYITGRTAADPLGMMQSPVLVKAGEESIRHPHDVDPPPYRVGDYSGIAVDPQDGTFWAAGEYAKVFPELLPLVGWGSALAHFSLSGGSAPSSLSAVGMVARPSGTPLPGRLPELVVPARGPGVESPATGPASLPPHRPVAVVRADSALGEVRRTAPVAPDGASLHFWSAPRRNNREPVELEAPSRPDWQGPPWRRD